MIVKLHGTSGSGKTTVARALLAGNIYNTVHNAANRKPEAYIMFHPYLKKQLAILGPYTATCGGLDSLNNVNEHIRLLEQYGHLNHVFYEGLLGSEYYGRIGKGSEVFGDSHVFAFLDTPIDVCIERVKQRRAAAGNTKPFNEDNTRGRVAKIERLKYRLETEFRRPTVVIDHKNAVAQILNIYKAAEDDSRI
jgi:gluconate kinase